MKSNHTWPLMVRAFCSSAVALTLLAAGTANGQTPACGADPTNYHVSRIDADTFGVEATFPTPVQRLDVYFFPNPDRPEGQADSIFDLTAYAADGHAIGIRYVGEGGWETGGEGASRITYRVRADHDQVDWGGAGPGKEEVATRFDETYFFVGNAFFLVDFSAPSCPVEVRFDLPPEWIVTSPWPMVGRIATVSEPLDLANNVFAMGADEPRRSRRGGVDVTWMSDSRVTDIEGRLDSLMNVLPEAYTDFWGRAPVEGLTAFFLADDMSDGGAFRDSFAMRIAVPLSGSDEIVWSHTLGHEIMHVWLGRGAIDSGDDIYWFAEGFADYLTIKLMWEAGLISEDRLADRLATILRHYELARRFSPQVGMSEAGADKSDNWELIYGGGSLVALLLDAELSAHDATAFRDLMRGVYGNPEQLYSHPELLAKMDTLSNGVASEIVQWVNSRPSFAELRSRLARSGIDAARFRSDEIYVTFPTCSNQTCVPSFLPGPE